MSSIISETTFIAQKILQTAQYFKRLNVKTPFTVFRTRNLPKDILKSKVCLPFNRYTNPIDFINTDVNISIWSQNHLDYLNNIRNKMKNNLENVIVKNPYKSQRLIEQCIQSRIQNMVVDSFEQIWKIHQCNYQSNSCNLPSLNFIWNVSDLQADLKQIQILISYNIKIKGLIINSQITSNINGVIRLIQAISKLNDEKDLTSSRQHNLNFIQIQINQENWELFTDLYLKNQYFKKHNVKVILDKIDFKMTKNYTIAAKVIGSNKRRQNVFHQDVYGYIKPQLIKKAQIIEIFNKKWLISEITSFPEPNILQEHYTRGYIIE